jgi:hypothetical protein
MTARRRRPAGACVARLVLAPTGRCPPAVELSPRRRAAAELYGSGVACAGAVRAATTTAKPKAGKAPTP